MGVGLNDIECPSARKLGSAREQLLKQIPVHLLESKKVRSLGMP
jgi:hypothetical protein